MKPEQRIGLTPIHVRLAASMLTKGEGHHPCERLGYTTALVETVEDWRNRARDDQPAAYFMEMRVNFYSGTRRVRWVDFKLSMTGGGGQPAFSVHEADDE